MTLTKEDAECCKYIDYISANRWPGWVKVMEDPNHHKSWTIAWYHPETQGASSKPKMAQDYSGCVGITQHLSGWHKIT